MRRRSIFGSIVLSITIAGGGYLIHSGWDPIGSYLESSSDIGKIASDFIVSTTSNKTTNLSDLLQDDKPTVINFWATWCKYCLEEMKYFEQLQIEGKANVVSINIDRVRTKEEIEQLLKDKQISTSFPIIYDPQNRIAIQYGVSAGLPVTFFLDGKGTITDRVDGTLSSYRSLESRVNNN